MHTRTLSFLTSIWIDGPHACAAQVEGQDEEQLRFLLAHDRDPSAAGRQASACCARCSWRCMLPPRTSPRRVLGPSNKH